MGGDHSTSTSAAEVRKVIPSPPQCTKTDRLQSLTERRLRRIQRRLLEYHRSPERFQASLDDIIDTARILSWVDDDMATIS